MWVKKNQIPKQQRGRMEGLAKGSNLNFGDFGLQAQEPGLPPVKLRPVVEL